MRKLIVCRGIPASGKTTYAKQLCKDTDFIRVNKDDIRAMFGKPYSADFEKTIRGTEHQIVVDLISNGYNVIIDDTNLKPEDMERWEKLVEDHNNDMFTHTVELEVKLFPISLEEAIGRDKNREASVGETVIEMLYERWKEIEIESRKHE